MVVGGRFNRHIFRRFVPAGLDHVLEGGFRVELSALALDLQQFGSEEPPREGAGRAIPLVEVDGADDGFKGAGEVAVAGAAAAGFLATPQNEVVAE